MNLKGLGTNLKLSTNKIAWIHWSLDLGPLSKVSLSLFLKLLGSQDVLIVKIWQEKNAVVLNDATHTAKILDIARGICVGCASIFIYVF
jgi:hypothetical protein